MKTFHTLSHVRLFSNNFFYTPINVMNKA